MEAIQTFENGERMSRAEEATLMPAPIVIHVAGGGVQIVSKPAGVIIEVHDFDTLSDSGESIRRFEAGQVIRKGRETGG